MLGKLKENVLLNRANGEVRGTTEIIKRKRGLP